MKKQSKPASLNSDPVYARIREILESARTHVARTVNTTQVVSNWLIGRVIVEEEQHGKKRADYGEELLASLAGKLRADGIAGYSLQNLRYMRQFFQSFPLLLTSEKTVKETTVDDLPLASQGSKSIGRRKIRHAVRGESSLIDPTTIHHALRGESWKPGQLHPNLSWTHYRTLLKVDQSEASAFYQIEAIANHWSARELERQINSLLEKVVGLWSLCCRVSPEETRGRWFAHRKHACLAVC